MIDNGLKNSPAYRVAYSMYVALGGDPMTDFDSVEAIYDAIDVLFGKGNNRITVETIAMEIVENGDYNFDDEEVTGYKPVNIKVEVPQKYTDEQVETIRVEAENNGYNTGYAEGFTQGETEGYNDGYAEGLDDGVEDQKALLEEITITENGVYEKEDGYNKVTVEVPETIFETETLTVELTDNGTYNYTPTTNGYSSVEVTVDVASSGGGNGFDFSVIGYDTEFSNMINNTTLERINYGKSIANNWSSDKTSMRYYFSDDRNLFYMPMVDTSNVTTMQGAFSSSNLAYLPQLDTSNVTAMDSAFYQCRSLTEIPQLDTSNVTTMQSMCNYCENLITVEALDCSKTTNIYQIFRNCSNLQNFGGFINLGMQENLYILSGIVTALNTCTKLTYTSMMNIINNLYDRTSAGYSVLSICFGSSLLSKLSDEEIAIATNKGWTLTT